MEFIPNTIAIYSVGLLGGSLGLALKQSGYKGTIIGLSSSAAIKDALAFGCIDEGYGYDKLGEIVKRCDLLFLCSPINTIIDTIRTLSTIDLPNGLVISDVGSTKQDIVEVSKLLPEGVHFIGGHPMAGSEKSGPSAADPFLFQNAIYVLSALTENATDLENSFALFLQKYLGCRTLYLNPATHDHIAATVSHVPHLLAVALVLLARQTEEKIPGTLTLAAGGFRDMTRIASASYSMWHDILTTNKQAIETQLDSYIEILGIIKRNLQEDSLSDAFDSARETRSRISSSGKGFIHPLSEILVRAKDQPGFIASLSKLLADKNYNIKDIEVVKVREGEGGTIRLAFDSSEISCKAIAVLTENGFSARERT
jgi:prephenate dehydrogenase